MSLPLYPPECQAACDAQQCFDYGDIIPLDWLQEHFQLVPPDSGKFRDFKTYQLRFLSAMDRFRSLMLEDYKKALNSERGVGYRVIHPTEQTFHTMDCLTDRVARECEKAMKSLENIRHDMLDNQQMIDNIDARSKVSMLRSLNKKPDIGFSITPKLGKVNEEAG
ncbi:MAG: hypothetical protein GY703_09615 [Gammaproteobacteria bacterium]|nr:hypothetical protein [Gammaproteobacteria bacterium]